MLTLSFSMKSGTALAYSTSPLNAGAAGFQGFQSLIPEKPHRQESSSDSSDGDIWLHSILVSPHCFSSSSSNLTLRERED
jgi:hypothetical protein